MKNPISAIKQRYILQAIKSSFDFYEKNLKYVSERMLLLHMLNDKVKYLNHFNVKSFLRNIIIEKPFSIQC